MTRTYRDPLDPGRVALTRDPYISDAAYAEMVAKTPIPCTDAAVTLEGDKALYLGKRSVYPMKGLWVLGGRIYFNDATLEDSVARCVEIETGHRFDPKRFVQLPTAHLYSWVKTRQGDFPGKNLAFTFRLEVSREELAHMSASLKPEEYDPGFGLRRFTREHLIDANCHQALVDIFDDMFGASS